MPMTNAAEPLFVDTNVLVYASWTAAPLHAHSRSILSAYRSAGAALVISRQVIREWLATLNRPRTGLLLIDLVAEAQTFEHHFTILDGTAAVTTHLLALLPQAGGMRVHDANIVATMQSVGMRRLLTNNPRHFDPFARLITILPLV
jgi:predicted nucleic acid-binding protein